MKITQYRTLRINTLSNSSTARAIAPKIEPVWGADNSAPYYINVLEFFRTCVTSKVSSPIERLDQAHFPFFLSGHCRSSGPRFSLCSDHFRLYPQTSSSEDDPRLGWPVVLRSCGTLQLCRTEFSAIDPHPVHQNCGLGVPGSENDVGNRFPGKRKNRCANKPDTRLLLTNVQTTSEMSCYALTNGMDAAALKSRTSEGQFEERRIIMQIVRIGLA